MAEVADRLRADIVGDEVTYVANRNINYTNVCTFKCKFCAFSKGPLSLNLRGAPYLLELGEITDRVAEAEAMGATEVCLQGGIHPDFDGDYYLARDPGRPRGVAHHPHPRVHRARGDRGRPPVGACRSPTTWCLLRDAGLRTLPGTAAEILDDEVRAVLCPDKIDTEQWLEAHRTAHGSDSTPTSPSCSAPSSSPGRGPATSCAPGPCSCETGGFTEFVPLPFVHMATPIYIQRRSRRGPTFRETVLMHAVGRIAYRGRHRQHPAELGEARRRRGPPAAAGRGQRPRRDPHRREHLAGRRGQPRPDDGRRRVPAPWSPRSDARSPSAPPCTAGSSTPTATAPCSPASTDVTGSSFEQRRARRRPSTARPRRPDRTAVPPSRSGSTGPAPRRSVASTARCSTRWPPCSTGAPT